MADVRKPKTRAQKEADAKKRKRAKADAAAVTARQKRALFAKRSKMPKPPKAGPSLGSVAAAQKANKPITGSGNTGRSVSSAPSPKVGKKPKKKVNNRGTRVDNYTAPKKAKKPSNNQSGMFSSSGPSAKSEPKAKESQKDSVIRRTKEKNQAPWYKRMFGESEKGKAVSTAPDPKVSSKVAAKKPKPADVRKPKKLQGLKAKPAAKPSKSTAAAVSTAPNPKVSSKKTPYKPTEAAKKSAETRRKAAEAGERGKKAATVGRKALNARDTSDYDDFEYKSPKAKAKAAAKKPRRKNARDTSDYDDFEYKSPPAPSKAKAPKKLAPLVKVPKSPIKIKPNDPKKLGSSSVSQEVAKKYGLKGQKASYDKNTFKGNELINKKDGKLTNFITSMWKT